MGCASSKVLPADAGGGLSRAGGAQGAHPAKPNGWRRRRCGRGSKDETRSEVQVNILHDSAAARDSGAPEATKYLKWRCSAACPPPAPPAELTADVVEQASGILAEITAHLATLKDKSPDMPTLVSLMEPEADWSCFAHWQLARISAINRCAGPRVQVVWWGSIAKLHRFPKWPDDVGHILDAEDMLKAYIEQMDGKGKIDGRIGCVAFFSHRWERPSMDPVTAHPDSSDHKKARHMAAVGKRGECATFVNHFWDLYYWVDIAGINQSCPVQKYLGIAKLPGYVAASSEMIMYDSSTADYEPRAWTRVERMLSFFYTWAPLFVYLSDADPDDAEDGAEDIVLRRPSDYIEDPSRPGGACMLVRDPLAPDAQLSDSGDKGIIQKLTEACAGVEPYNPEMRGLSSGEFRLGSSYMPVCRPRMPPVAHWVSTASTVSTAFCSAEADVVQ